VRLGQPTKHVNGISKLSSSRRNQIIDLREPLVYALKDEGQLQEVTHERCEARIVKMRRALEQSTRGLARALIASM
jgi:hypothetical protein